MTILKPITKELLAQAIAEGFESNGASFAPDYIYRIKIANANNSWPMLPADVHDLRYHFGGTETERAAADLEFLYGLLEQVEAAWWPLRILARRRCYTYYEAVRLVGKKFWSSKETRKGPIFRLAARILRKGR